MIPHRLRSLFWDVSLEAFDPVAFPDYTISRILEYGDKEAVAWLKRIFTEEAIKRVISSERRLSCGFRGKPITIPGSSRSPFRNDSDHDFGEADHFAAGIGSLIG